MLAVALAGFGGVIVGAVIVVICFNLQVKYYDRKEKRKRELELKIREIEALNDLNKKINEILQKRTILLDKYVSFDAFDDCYITVDDFVYLQSFAAQNNFYLPSYLLEEFFKNIAQRRVILAPEETTQIGGYTYKGGRMILENFSDEIMRIMNEKKIQIKKINSDELTYLGGSK